jgi:Contractile injection system tube protein
MSTFPNSPRLLKGGIVLIDPSSGAVQRIITLQYNPDTLTRSLQVQSVEATTKDRSEALRLKGPPIETFKVEAELDATDQLEFPDQNQSSTQFGVGPQLAALETIVYPTSQQLLTANSLAQAGTLEIAPMESPLTLFVWSKNRVVPVRITDFSITEEAFDANLNPIRAKVSLGMRVLSVDDLGFDDKGGNLFMVYQQQKEKLATLNKNGTFRDLGIGGIP